MALFKQSITQEILWYCFGFFTEPPLHNYSDFKTVKEQKTGSVIHVTVARVYSNPAPSDCWCHTNCQHHCLWTTMITTQLMALHPGQRGWASTRNNSFSHSLDFTEARDSEWQWTQLGHMQFCTLLQTDNHASTSPLSFLQAGYPSCRPTSSVKALKAFIQSFLLKLKSIFTIKH